MSDLTTWDGVREAALASAKTLSDMQFRLGFLALVAKEYFPVEFVDYKTFAAELNMRSKSLNEYANVVDFYSDKGLPNDLRQRIEDLHELRETHAVRYTHFRSAKRIGTLDTTLDRTTQVEAAVTWLEARLDAGETVDVIDARVAAETGGEPFERMSIVWDSQGWNDTWLEVGNTIQGQISTLVGQNKKWRVVVYEKYPSDL